MELASARSTGLAIQHGRHLCRAFHGAHHPLALEPAPELGPGVYPQRSGEALARLCAEPDVQAVIAFGSRARGEARPDSDQDLAVIVGQPHPPPKQGPARGLLRAGCGGVPPIQPEFLRLQQIGVCPMPPCWHDLASQQDRAGQS